MFIPESEKSQYLKQIKEYFNENNIFKSFISYFEKYWSNNNFLNFEECNKNDILERTDNVCENFHNRLNNLIQNPHPKISYLLDKLKLLTKIQFDKLVNSFLLNVDNIEKDFSVYEDVVNFLKTLKEKYNTKISFDFIKNLENNEEKNLKDISLKIIEKVLNVNINEDLDSENLNEIDNLNLDNSVDKEEILGNCEKEDEKFKEKNDQYDEIFNLEENKKTFKKKSQN